VCGARSYTKVKDPVTYALVPLGHLTGALLVPTAEIYGLAKTAAQPPH